jgi:hypothetical protein
MPDQAPGGDVGHHAVQRLAVEVDDPQHLAQPRDHRVDDASHTAPSSSSASPSSAIWRPPRGTSKCPAT